MENYPIDNFKDMIEWELFLPIRESLSFKFSVLPKDNREDMESIDVDFTNDLLRILQDTFYVTHLANISHEKDSDGKNDELDERDNNWSIFRWVWYNFTDFLRDNLNEIRIFQNSDELEILSKKKGREYTQFVKEMGQPFVARYNLYIFSLLFWSKNYILRHFGSCTEIICEQRMFLQFWNGVLTFLSESVRDIQKTDVESLMSKFEKILKAPDKKADYTKFYKDYLGEEGGCFSLTMVKKKDKSREDILCFSGLKDYTEDSNIGKAIKKIKDNGGFKHPKVIKVKDDIRYDLMCGFNISYVEAKKCKLFASGKYNRMFSCCERKTIADYTWDDCNSYEMIVKYAPCELCIAPISKHNYLYHGKVIHGKATKPLSRLKEFETLAICIFMSVNPRMKHFPHLCNYCSLISKP